MHTLIKHHDLVTGATEVVLDTLSHAFAESVMVKYLQTESADEVYYLEDVIDDDDFH